MNEIFILSIIGVLLTVTTAILQLPPSPINYQPANIQSRQFYFSDTSGIPVPANSGSDHVINFPVTYQRIHNIIPQNFKVALCLAAISYDIPINSTTTDANSARIYFLVINMIPPKFDISIRLEVVSRFYFAKSRYLAVNYVDNTLFYFQDHSRFVNSSLNPTTPATISTLNYISVPPTSEYEIFFVLRGLNIAKSINAPISIDVSLSFAASDYQVKILGDTNVHLRNLHITVIYIKKILMLNHPTSLILHTRILTISNPGCTAAFNGFGYCVAYNSQTNIPSFRLLNTNYMLGVQAFNFPNLLNFQIEIDGPRLDASIDQNSQMKLRGILFFGLGCPDGFHVRISDAICVRCQPNCLRCEIDQCLECRDDYIIDTDLISCKLNIALPASFDQCLHWQELSGLLKCIFCDQIKKFSSFADIDGCQCKQGYEFSPATNICEQICGDGLIFDAQCDDGNVIDNDGCSSTCRIEQGFSCVTLTSQTLCQSLQQLTYSIHKILKDQESTGKATIILKPLNKLIPYEILMNNFAPNNNTLTHLNFQIYLQTSPNQQTFSPTYKLDKIQNNLIYLSFEYDFTVQNLTAVINLDYSETRYIKRNQTIEFQLKGQNEPLKFSGFMTQYNIISNNIMATAIVSMIGLLIGLFVPKFIGLESIITMQLIFYSQLLVVDFHNWPASFVMFDRFKVATGYNELLNLTEYLPLNNITKKLEKLYIHKTFLQNINISLLLFGTLAIVFYVVSIIRNHKQTQLQKQVQQSKHDPMITTSMIKEASDQYRKIDNVNNFLYWIVNQLCVWSILPMLSSLAGESLIDNVIVQVNEVTGIVKLLISMRSLGFLLFTVFIFSVGLNMFKNLLISFRTVRKIEQRPEQHLYKKLLFFYLFVIGWLIFFFNQVRIASLIPVSSIVLVIHLVFTITIMIIKPYKQSLRIHAVGLYLNQVVYLVFLGAINLINFIEDFDEFFLLCLGYFVSGMGWLLIILTIVRLYYELRYGQALQKKIQQERRLAKQAEKAQKQKKLKKQINALELWAKQKLSNAQKLRDLNQYLIQTQIKQQQKNHLMAWLQARNWSQQQKERYYYKQFYEKPLKWMKQNDKNKYQNKINEQKIKQETERKKRAKTKDDPEYIELIKRMKSDFQKNQKTENFKTKFAK